AWKGLYESIVARARYHPPAITQPAVPELLVFGARVQTRRFWMEHEARVFSECCEVAARVRRGEGRHDLIRPLECLLFTRGSFCLVHEFSVEVRRGRWQGYVVSLRAIAVTSS